MRYGKNDSKNNNYIGEWFIDIHEKEIFHARKKKKGFTLIEIIAVIAIIGILASVILPKVDGYIKEAKKVKVVDQCRKVVMAVESYNLRSDSALVQNVSISNAMKNNGVKKYLDGVELSNLDTEATSLKNCYDILNGAEFDLTKDSNILNPASIAKP